MNQVERKERGLSLLYEMLGKENAETVRQRWREVCPDFEEYVVGFLSGESWTRPKLDRRMRSLVTLGALVALGRWRGLELNVRMALNNGLTREEILEAFLHLAPYAGFPAAWESMEIADRVFRESK